MTQLTWDCFYIMRKTKKMGERNKKGKGGEFFFLSGSGHKIKKVCSKLAKPEGTGSNSMGNEGRKGQT